MVFVYDRTAKTKLREGGPRIGQPTEQMEIQEAESPYAPGRAGAPVATTRQLDIEGARRRKQAGEAAKSAKAAKATTGGSSTTQRKHRPEKEAGCCEIM